MDEGPKGYTTAEESFLELRDDLHAIIVAMRDRIGRMPTQEEVTSLIWAETDADRDRVLNEAASK